MVDRFSRWPEVIPLMDIQVQTIVDFFCLGGFPALASVPLSLRTEEHSLNPVFFNLFSRNPELLAFAQLAITRLPMEWSNAYTAHLKHH